MLQLNNQKQTLKNISLSLNESALLKTYALDYSIDEVLELLDIKVDKYETLIEKLSSLYESNNFFEVISLAIANEHINRYDLVKNETKEIAKIYVDKIYNYIENNGNDNLQEITIFNFLKNYMKAVHDLFTKNSSLNLKSVLDNEAYEYLKEKLNHNKNLLGNFNANQSIETRLTTTFQTANFFNAARQIFELNLISQSVFNTDYENFEKKLKKKTKNKLLSIKKIKKATIKERQLYIYFDLIDYYNTLEDKFLSINSNNI